ncbi:MAG: hypothetical protein A2Z04_09920, partial [Chloroflexi bacterium RBG_16_57_9]
KSTAHSILETLSHYGLLERDAATKTYRLGYGLFELGNLVADRMEVRQVAQPFLRDLAQAVEETVFLGVFRDDHVIIVDKEESPHDVKITSPLGRRIPHCAGAFGKVFHAAMPESDLDRLIKRKGLRAFTVFSLTDADAYRTELEQVRSLGYALDREEYLAEVRAGGAPVVNAHNQVVAALCVVGFSSRLPDTRLEQVAQQVRQAAEEVSRRLGARGYPAWDGIG